ncbi:hypothetical protein NEOLI_005332 [Neolecta irregularis DAH-3]|uniref:Uncharacterized protein n=1 Tax=Neolecta irregularis (strain DAH-3) TaxID=1198029 RepID=A0A1U7LL68_NEOID|nr:hypothetical protein NEOLI_005332 [Neolecta irregularis DAH-3]|eukprot:OLL23378.1 hypothetical protein NEOLI_005332 [Neolecta irregularis DAH-3]
MATLFVAYWLISINHLPSTAQHHYGLLKSLSICPLPPPRYCVVNPFLGEPRAFGTGGKTATFYQKENQERQRLNQTLNEKKAQRVKGKENESPLILTSKKTLLRESLKYDIPVAGGQKRLPELRQTWATHCFDGCFWSGQNYVISHCGASHLRASLLDVLANRDLQHYYFDLQRT